MADQGATATQKYPTTSYAWKSNTGGSPTGYDYGTASATARVSRPKVRVWNAATSHWDMVPNP